MLKKPFEVDALKRVLESTVRRRNTAPGQQDQSHP